MNGNGHEELDISESTEDATKDEILDRSMVEQAFIRSESNDNIRLLLSIGKSIDELAFRSDLPSKPFWLGFTIQKSGCLEHQYKEGLVWLKDLLAGLPAIRGKRAQLFSDTITGEKRMAGNIHNEGVAQRFKKWIAGD